MGRRFARPPLNAWSEGPALRLQRLLADPQDAGPKAPRCYGLLRADTGQRLLRFVRGRPLSRVTEDFLDWVGERPAMERVCTHYGCTREPDARESSRPFPGDS